MEWTEHPGTATVDVRDHQAGASTIPDSSLRTAHRRQALRPGIIRARVTTWERWKLSGLVTMCETLHVRSKAQMRLGRSVAERSCTRWPTCLVRGNLVTMRWWRRHLDQGVLAQTLTSQVLWSPWPVGPPDVVARLRPSSPTADKAWALRQESALLDPHHRGRDHRPAERRAVNFDGIKYAKEADRECSSSLVAMGRTPATPYFASARDYYFTAVRVGRKATMERHARQMRRRRTGARTGGPYACKSGCRPTAGPQHPCARHYTLNPAARRLVSSRPGGTAEHPPCARNAIAIAAVCE